ncbi:Eco57I restriction-modification methylase domain-containing protein, partial [Janthinobacterium sp.]|uniref:Eco57I restriction-modification methylase domain-containing protein n=1 Tax=Janthinobacterium sp. TaxID=1871054 RepID=UPI00293D66E9
QNRWPLEASLAAAHAIVDGGERDKRVDEAEAALKKLDRDFSDANHADYARKLYLIDKCIYGVDIQPIAVQIAKLRFFISLVVSQKIDINAENKNVTALPNLETKLVAANSLIPIERPKTDDLFRNKTIEVKEQQLSAMQARYFGARTAKTKRARRDDINRLRDELAELLKTDRSLPERDAKKMAAWDQFDQNDYAPFFDPEWMFGLTEKFDITIGNPPYVRQEKIDDLYKGFKVDLETIYGKKDTRGTPLGGYSGTADLYIYFIQRSIELLNPGGAFSFITSNKWYRAKYGERLRGWINRQAQIKTVIDFGDAEVFDAIAYPTILVATRRLKPEAGAQNGDVLRVMNWPQEKERDEVETFPELMKTLAFDMPQKALSPTGWQLEPHAKRALLERIRAAGKPLGEYVEGRFYRGILTGFNDAFVIDGPTKDRLIAEHESSRAIIKPFLRGRDIKRWRVEPQDLWLIFTRRGLEIDRYPAIKRHLSVYRDSLEPKPENWDEDKDGEWKGRKAGSYKWYDIQDNIAYWEAFEEPKIIVPAIQNKVDYAPDLTGYYSNDKTSIIVSEHWAYLLAILNSTVSWWLTQQLFASKQGGYYEFKPMYVAAVPIPSCADGTRAMIEGAVKAIVAGSADPRLEQLLNGFVYELFFKDDLHARGLTLFDEATSAGLGKLDGLEGEKLVKEAQEFADRVFKPSHPLYAMLFDLQALDVVRIIE